VKKKHPSLIHLLKNKR